MRNGAKRRSVQCQHCSSSSSSSSSSGVPWEKDPASFSLLVPNAVPEGRQHKKGTKRAHVLYVSPNLYLLALACSIST